MFYFQTAGEQALPTSDRSLREIVFLRRPLYYGVA
jgi:hypothetical protein